MLGTYKNSFIKYAKDNGIIQTSFEEEKLDKNKLSEKLVLDHIELLSEFHKKISGYEDYVYNTLQDRRGKLLQQCRIYFKKVKRQYNNAKEGIEVDDFKKILIQYGSTYIKRAQFSLEKLDDSIYLKLIKRSMDKKEICLGNPYIGSIRKINYLEVNSLNDCFYDQVELDLVWIINRLMKKGVVLNYKNIINKYCIFEGLDNDSEKFIEALVIYPYEFIKCCIRYNRTKNKKYRDKLIKIISEDIYSNYKEGWIYASKCSV